MSAVPVRPAVEPVVLPRALARRLALPLVFCAGTLYHFLQSRGHATPTVFNDELLYAKLSQSLAAGQGLAIRGHDYFFPSFLASVVQAPAWLLHSMTDAYAAAKFINAAVMASAAIPAYLLARRVVRPSFALLTAAAAVATPAMLYHAYLMSEAPAYPVFLWAVLVIVHGVEKPSLLVPLMCVVAVATRVQFLVLPLAYFAAVALCARGRYRQHLVPVAVCALLVAVLVAVPGALGDYGRAAQLGFDFGGIAHWALLTGALLPFSLGLALVAGALYGLRGPVGVVTVACTTLFLAQAALIAAGEAHRPLERYLFYVTPLVVLAFFAYVERGAPGRLQYALFACGGAVALSLLSLPGLTGTGAFFFDSVTLSGFARASYELGLTNASLLYSVAPLAVAALVCALPLRRRGVPELLAVLAIALMLSGGAGAYATDRLVTQWSAEKFGGQPLDWLDRSGLGPATYLVLPHGNSFLGSNLESWNRNVRSVAVLGTAPPDQLPSSRAWIARDGTFHFDGPRTIVANVSGTQIDVEGQTLARPRPGLTVFRMPGRGHVRSLARGLAPDGLTGTKLRYQTWPIRPGRYELTIAVPKGAHERRVKVGGQTLVLRGNKPRRFNVPTNGAPLAVDVDVPNAPLGGRVLGVQVLALRFVPR